MSGQVTQPHLDLKAPPPLPAEPTLLFMGDYGYDPNREAAERGATRILPAVRRRVPGARLLIAGKRTERLDRAAEGLGFADGREILLADEDDALAAGCVRVLEDEGLCRTLGAAARDKARADYEAGRIRDRVAGLLRGMVAGA